MSAHILIVEARFHNSIGDMLVRGATDALKVAGATFDHIQVPGALEIPGAIAIAGQSKKYDAFVALGCVIRGETYHFEVVSDESARGIGALTLQGLAIGNGIITAENYEQAEVRADPAKHNKGAETVRAALALHDLKKKYDVK